MAIKRTATKVDHDFTIMPNGWLRDSRLSLRARGVLGLLMSHQVGWKVSIESMARENPEGKAAIRTAVNELIEYGYLKRVHNHENGRLRGYDYVLCDPPVRLQACEKQTTEKQTTEKQTTVNRTPKKTINKEDQVKENHQEENHLPNAHETAGERPRSMPGRISYSQIFEQFWETYPRKENKPEAWEQWRAASHLNTASTIIAGAARYRDNPHRNPQYTLSPARWLKERRWEDGPAEPPRPQQPDPTYKPGWQKRLEYNAQLNQQYQDPGAEFLRSIEQ